MMDTYANSPIPINGEVDSMLVIPGLPLELGDFEPLSDGDLVSRIREGDLVALEELLGRHAENLLRLAWKFVRNEQDAREILQEVFVTTWRKLPAFEGRSQIGTWLYRVTVNASLMHLRKRGRRSECVDFTNDNWAADATVSSDEADRAQRARPDEQLESQELRRALARAIDGLPAALCSVFDLRELQGWSTRKTARWLGLTDSAVKTRLHRARLALRAEMAGYLVQ